MDGFDVNGFGGGIPASSALLAWQMFVNSGEPGMYMLYKDLMREEDERLR